MKPQSVITTHAAAETEQLGEDIGRKLKGGELIELISDLGGGKTTFVRGLVKGAGSVDHVSSPTYTVSKIYIATHFAIHHFDFYRLTEAGLMEHELMELSGDQKIVTVIEWGDALRHVLPEKRLTIEIEQLDTDERAIRVSADESLAYLTEED